MSDFRVFQTLSFRLRGLLLSGLDGEVGNFAVESSISFDSPGQILDSNNNNGPLLSLYLYQVTSNAHINNYPRIQTPGDRQLYPPMSLDLFYLLTPFGATSEENLTILGRSLQVLHAIPILQNQFLDSTLNPSQPETRILFNPVSLEEQTRIWNAFNQAYRLSACYKVTPVSIDSIRAPEEDPAVFEHLIDVNQITRTT